MYKLEHIWLDISAHANHSIQYIWYIHFAWVQLIPVGGMWVVSCICVFVRAREFNFLFVSRPRSAYSRSPSWLCIATWLVVLRWPVRHPRGTSEFRAPLQRRAVCDSKPRPTTYTRRSSWYCIVVCIYFKIYVTVQLEPVRVRFAVGFVYKAMSSPETERKLLPMQWCDILVRTSVQMQPISKYHTIGQQSN